MHTAHYRKPNNSLLPDGHKGCIKANLVVHKECSGVSLFLQILSKVNRGGSSRSSIILVSFVVSMIHRINELLTNDVFLVSKLLLGYEEAL